MEVELSQIRHSACAIWKHAKANHVDICSSKFCLTDRHRAKSESPAQTRTGMERGSDVI